MRSEAEAILLPSDEPDPTYPWLQKIPDDYHMGFSRPMRGARAFGQLWTIATNGHMLVFVPDGHANAVIESTSQDKLDNVLATWPKGETHVVGLAYLKSFVGAETPECHACRGEKRTCHRCNDGYVECKCAECDNEHDTACPDCGGSQVIACKECEVPSGSGARAHRLRLYDAQEVNVKLMRAAIRHFDDATVSITLPAIATALSPIGIEGRDWKVLAMPLRPSIYVEGEGPPTIHFPPKVPRDG